MKKITEGKEVVIDRRCYLRQGGQGRIYKKGIETFELSEVKE